MTSGAKSRTRTWATGVLIAGLFGVVGCGGGGGSDAGSKPTPKPAPTVQGTAAAGAPIIGTVTLKDSSSPAVTVSGPIRTDGTYTLDVTNLTPPFMLRADGKVGGRAYSLYSAGAAADVNGTINITPLTDLIIANVAGELAGTYFESGDFSVFTSEQIAEKTADLREKLVPILEAVGLETSIDLLRMSFAADHSGLDAVLDIIDVEYDTSNMVATITNIVNDESVTSDIDTGTVSGDPIDPGDAVTTISALQSISTRLDAFAKLYATRLPTETEIENVGLFDTSDFLDNGQNWDVFVSGLIEEVPLGFRCSDAAIVRVGTDTMLVSFNFIEEGEDPEAITWEFRKDSASGVYLAAGNRRLFEIEMGSHSNYYPQEQVGSRFSSGFGVTIADPQNLLGGNGQAVVRGPGGIQRTFYQDIKWERFSQSREYDDPMIWLTDDAIAQLPELNAIFTVDVSFVGSAEPYASYEVVIPKRPARLSELSVASFIGPETFSPSNLVGFAGGTITATWTVPAALRNPWFFVYLHDASHNAWLDGYVSSSGTSGTIVVPDSVFSAGDGWSAQHGFSFAGAQDVFDRRYETRLKVF